MAAINKRNDRYGEAVGIGIEREGKLVGGIVYHEYNGAQIVIHVASDGTRRWINREFLFVIFDYAFRQLELNRVTGIVAASNIAALNFDKRVGFVEESRMKDAHPDGDLIILKMTKADCRWLHWKKDSP